MEKKKDYIHTNLGCTMFCIPTGAIVEIYQPIQIEQTLLTPPEQTATRHTSVGFSITAEGLAVTDADSWIKSDNCQEVTAMVFLDHRRLPRKIKKAYISEYQRNTKWKRKVESWLRRSKYKMSGTLHMDEGNMTISGRIDD